MTIAPLPLETDEDFYPTGDGKPMAETDIHLDPMFYLIQTLHLRYVNDPDVYVAGNNFLYFEQGVPRSVVSPDCYVVFGVPKRKRDTYMTWLEGGIVPAVVFEITSRSTRAEDTHIKLPIYEQKLGVAEYFLFDPTGDYLRSRLRGYRLMNGRYEEIPRVEGRLHSEQLGLDLVQEGNTLRLFDPVRGVMLPTALQTAQHAEEETQRAEESMFRAETEAHRAEEAVRRAETEAQRANDEAQRAEAAARRAETEAQRADEAIRRANEEARLRAGAEADIVRLRAELAALRGKPQD